MGSLQTSLPTSLINWQPERIQTTLMFTFNLSYFCSKSWNKNMLSSINETASSPFWFLGSSHFNRRPNKFYQIKYAKQIITENKTAMQETKKAETVKGARNPTWQCFPAKNIRCHICWKVEKLEKIIVGVGNLKQWVFHREVKYEKRVNCEVRNRSIERASCGEWNYRKASSFATHVANLLALLVASDVADLGSPITAPTPRPKQY